MRTHMALLILLALTVPQASAVADPDPDGIGVYFDMSADILQIMMEPGVPFFAHVILTNPSAGDLLAYEFSYRIEVPLGLESMFVRLGLLFPDFVPGDITLPFYDIFDDEIALGPFPSAHIPGSPAVLLLTWQFLLLVPMDASFYLGPTSGENGSTGQMAYETETGFVTMNPSTGNPEFPVATINGDWVIPVTETTFGSLKALYR